MSSNDKIRLFYVIYVIVYTGDMRMDPRSHEQARFLLLFALNAGLTLFHFVVLLFTFNCVGIKLKKQGAVGSKMVIL